MECVYNKESINKLNQKLVRYVDTYYNLQSESSSSESESELISETDVFMDDYYVLNKKYMNALKYIRKN